NIASTGCAMAIIEDPQLRRAFSAELHGSVPDVTALGLVAGLAAYSGACDEWLAAQIAYLRNNRDAVAAAVAACPRTSMARVEATYLAWIDVRALGLADPHAHFLS